MNAPAVQSIPVVKLAGSPDNPRRRFNETSLAELAASIRAHGVLQPLVARPAAGWTVEPNKSGGRSVWSVVPRSRGNSDGAPEGEAPSFPTEEAARAALPTFEVVAGERRLRAARLAGVAEVPVIVRELDDIQAAEIQILENLQREDISPLEEASGFKRLIDLGAYTPDTLAERLGKSRSHVFGRLRLLKVCPAVQEALRKGKIEASVVDLLAKFPEHVQPEVLEAVMPEAWRGGQPRSFRECREIVADYWPELKGAPWWKKDPADLVPEAGACAACLKRSANMPDLEGLAGSGDVCTDGRCFRAKLEGWREGRLAELRDKGRDVLTGREADELFPRREDRQPRTGTGWVALSEVCHATDEATSWGELLKGLEVAAKTAVTLGGKVVELVRESEARDALIAAGKIPAERAGPEAGKRERAQVIQENRRRREIERRVGEACVAAVGALEEGAFLRLLMSRAVGNASVAAEARGVELEGCTVPVLRGVCMQALSWSKAGGWQAWQLEHWAKGCGIDRKRIEREVVDEEKEGKPKRETVKAPKKRARRRKGGRGGQ